MKILKRSIEHWLFCDRFESTTTWMKAPHDALNNNLLHKSTDDYVAVARSKSYVRAFDGARRNLYRNFAVHRLPVGIISRSIRLSILNNNSQTSIKLPWNGHHPCQRWTTFLCNSSRPLGHWQRPIRKDNSSRHNHCPPAIDCPVPRIFTDNYDEWSSTLVRSDIPDCSFVSVFAGHR